MTGGARPPVWERQPDPADAWPLADPARALLRDDRNVVAVVGAGMNSGAGLPLGWQLSMWLAEHMPTADGQPIPDDRKSDLSHVASRIVGVPYSPGVEVRSEALLNRAAQHLSGFSPRPGIATWALTRVASKFIVTLNYDLVLERAAADQRIPFRSLTWKHAGEAVQLLSPESEPGDLIIVHIHGSLEDPSSMVLAGDGYANLANQQTVKDFWATLARMRRMLFLGLSLDEVYIVETLGRVQGGSRKHVFVTDQPTAENIAAGRMSVDWLRHGITQLVLPTAADGKPDYGKLNGLCWNLVSHVSSPRRGAAKLICRTQTPRAAFYTPGALVESRPGENETAATLLSEWDFAGNARWRRLFGDSVTHRSELDVATQPHTLLVGEPGVGKTELLRAVGDLVPSSYTAVLIRLADVDTRPGAPALVLSRWAAKGEAITEDEVAVDAESLEQRDFHFLLDGLDEVDVGAHAEAIRRISELADRFPQHRWTISTRPMDGLDAFDQNLWQYVRAIATHAWQAEYLRQRGLEWERDIQPHVQGINDARDLLRLPFFLVRVVEMRNRGALQATRDLWGLLQALVSDALQREEDLITLPPNDAREWLRRVALSMLLVGRSTLTQAEIRDIPLPQSTTASHAQVCSILAQRLMLRPTGGTGQVAFTHRMFGACLAAEGLDAAGPTRQLLDALIPDVSTLVRGARLDAVVPLSLVMSRNARWRQAVRSRDVVAAARATPSDASPGERLMAARAVWERYEEWGVWIRDRDRPEIAEDGGSLARLLAPRDLPEIETPIRAALDSADMVAQGNAITVLSLAGFEDIAPQLQNILENDNLEAVVRREAAIAAQRLRLYELLELIVRRAVVTKDDAEVQDCSMIAMNMASDEDVVRIAFQLIESPQRTARGFALARLARRVAPQVTIKALRRYAERTDDRHSRESDMLIETVGKLEAADADTVRDLAFLTVLWAIGDPRVTAVLKRDLAAAALGAADALARERVYGFQARAVADLLTVEQMRTAGWPADIVDRTEAHRAAAAMPQMPAAEIESFSDDDENDVEEPPTLAELLARERDPATDSLIAQNSNYFTEQARELPPAVKQDLANRLEGWWPHKPYADTITWKPPQAGGSRAWTQEREAAAWVWYGPAVNKAVTPRQWAEILAAGAAPFEEQVDWLAAQYTPEGAELLAEIMDSDDGSFWYSAFRAIPAGHPLPLKLIEAALGQLRQGDSYRVAYLGERMAESAGAEPLYRLSEISARFADVVRPLLALRGDQDALALLFGQLRDTLTNRGSFDSDELSWLDGVGEDERWLDTLFECLTLAYTRPGQVPGRDALTSLLNTIAQVGARHPEPVIRRYDQLFARHAECRWLRQRREDVVQLAVGNAGLQAAGTATQALGLPHLPSQL